MESEYQLTGHPVDTLYCMYLSKHVILWIPNGKIRIVLVNESTYVCSIMRVSNSEHNGAKIFMRLHSILKMKFYQKFG